MNSMIENRSHKLSDAEYNQRWLERVRAFADRQESGCLLSKYGTNGWGYAQTNYRDKTVRVHRKLYQIVHGVTLPRKIDVCHTCDVRACIEISHLWPGTRKENLLDASAKGRVHCQKKTHCTRGHSYAEHGVRHGKDQWRQCRICARGRQRMKDGWSEEEAFSVAAIAPNAPSERRTSRWLKKRAA